MKSGLARFLENRLPQFRGAFSISRIGEGQSCLTFLVSGEGWRVVLRRPPRGELPPSAFDVLREHRMLRTLTRLESCVPVPRPLADCGDPSVIGAPFYLMEYVEGVVLRDRLPPPLSGPPTRRGIGEQLVDTLASLHHVDYRAAGAEIRGDPGQYLDRQLRRMRQLWSLARSRDIPEIEELGVWLEEHAPPQNRTSIVHGDYKLDNVVFTPEPPLRLIAVLDWEMSTVGDPLADLGWLLYFWREPGEPRIGLAAASVTNLGGFLGRRDLLERYVGRTGFPVDAINWYMALAGWKIAIILEGSYRRFLAGVTDHALFADLDGAVPALARRALRAAATGPEM
jgi:aminoglycoside phosphotransferase (APT) family kinase protein